MSKFITLNEAYVRLDEAQRKKESFPTTHADYMKKYFPDDEPEPEPEEVPDINALASNSTRQEVNFNDPAYDTTFADQLAAQMYPKPKQPEKKMSPAEVYQSMYGGEENEPSNIDRLRPGYTLAPNPRVAHFWSDEAKSLYSRIANGTEEQRTFEIDTDQSAFYGKIKSPELYEVLDQALDRNLDISDSVWNLMQDKNKKLYNDLQKSMGIGTPPTKVSDFELFNILRSHPDHVGRSGVKYKENAGTYKLKDMKKRIRAKYGAGADEKIAELEQYINQNRRYPQ